MILIYAWRVILVTHIQTHTCRHSRYERKEAHKFKHCDSSRGIEFAKRTTRLPFTYDKAANNSHVWCTVSVFKQVQLSVLQTYTNVTEYHIYVWFKSRGFMTYVNMRRLAIIYDRDVRKLRAWNVIQFYIFLFSWMWERKCVCMHVYDSLCHNSVYI